MRERRVRGRDRAFKPGIIELGGSSISCIVRNLSEDGASLDVVKSHGLPDCFVLVMALNGMRRYCRVVWRKNMRIGVAFDLIST